MTPFGGRLGDTVTADVERWNLKDQLIDVFAEVDPDLRGQVKQVVDFRNWVAHGWHTQPSAAVERIPPTADAEDAFDKPTAFLQQSGVLS